MIYWKIFIAFFIPGILGYGGGPSSIPLIEHEVVDRYHWLSVHEFSEMLALGNALPGPIATKMAGYIGYQQGGLLGSFIALFATVAPSLILMLPLLGLLLKHKDSPKVKRMTQLVRPTIAVLLGVMTFDFFASSVEGSGYFHTMIIGLISLLLLKKWKVHPAFVIAGALVYGAIFL
ncbi:chromate transporter [Lederbergia sp. NSJ-179]|uniref:chromate transporter n=1 Tax=Lederbergia sp. NSJ-179 TaxID=2931402 RepID=UPI001FD26E48|nr:chromate transporter [Lederbergia sp. NSJ-179]MCJ7840178.1 chromate transporter [Lederbergia sp. NSJ-179]